MLQSLMAGILSLLVTIGVMPFFIRFYQKAKIGGQQMHEDVKQHLEKAGTPTMGGIVFLVVSSLVTLFFSLFSGLTTGTIALLFILLLYGAIGFFDDFLKIFRQINEGLKPRQKLLLQIVGGVVFYLLYRSAGGSDSLNLFGYMLPLGILYAAFILFWLVGFSNAVNLTDGLDGLASISVVISLLAYAVIAVVQKQYDVLLVISSMVGALLGFFKFNYKPAKVFMGDVGSLALGAMLATLSIWLHQEWTLLFIGIVYVLETSSVILQTTYFRYTKKRFGEGRRIFRMSPLHHHLELGGLTGKGNPWTEWQVDGFMWLIGLLFSLLTLASLYLGG